MTHTYGMGGIIFGGLVYIKKQIFVFQSKVIQLLLRPQKNT
jgi:hypothetical protein